MPRDFQSADTKPLTQDPRRRAFFDELVTRLKGESALDDKLTFIVVSHTLPDKPDFVDALGKLGRVSAVVRKSTFQDPNAIAQFESMGVPLPDVTKQQLQDPAFAKNFIKQQLNPGEKAVIVDVGGYFAPALAELSHDEEIGDRIAAVVEDTENGHQKYEKIQDMVHPQVPLYSVARSPLKINEDYNVGKSIVRSADTILREDTDRFLEVVGKVGVIGAGKIGHSVAIHLNGVGADSSVYDMNPQRMADAKKSGLRTIPSSERESWLANCDMLFCNTGAGALATEDLKHLKDGVYIASSTSADDEFKIQESEGNLVDWLHNHARKSVKRGNILTFELEDGRHINFMNDGNSVNFVHNAVIGPVMQLVQGEIIQNVFNAMRGEQRTQHLQEATREQRECIMNNWTMHFGTHAAKALADESYKGLFQNGR